MTSELQDGIGVAWLALAAELQQELREDDPEARVNATISPDGLLALEVSTIRERRAWAVALARRYEASAARSCEHCGGRVTVAGAGAVVTILCADCENSPPHLKGQIGP